MAEIKEGQWVGVPVSPCPPLAVPPLLSDPASWLRSSSESCLSGADLSLPEATRRPASQHWGPSRPGCHRPGCPLGPAAQDPRNGCPLKLQQSTVVLQSLLILFLHWLSCGGSALLCAASLPRRNGQWQGLLPGSAGSRLAQHRANPRLLPPEPACSLPPASSPSARPKPGGSPSSPLGGTLGPPRLTHTTRPLLHFRCPRVHRASRSPLEASCAPSPVCQPHSSPNAQRLPGHPDPRPRPAVPPPPPKRLREGSGKGGANGSGCCGPVSWGAVSCEETASWVGFGKGEASRIQGELEKTSGGRWGYRPSLGSL